MRTRSRAGPDENVTKEDGLVALPPQPPRSSKKRKAPTVAEPTTPSPADKPTPKKAAPAPSSSKKAKASVGRGEAIVADPTPSSSPEPRKASDAGSEESLKEGNAGSVKDGAVSDQSPGEPKAQDTTAAPKGKGGEVAALATAVARAAVAPVVPKGRCVSGRDWKVRNQSQRASMQVTTATETLSTTWAKKLEIKAKRQAIIAMEREMKDRKRQEIEDKKQEKLEREKRRQQNEMKNTTYQTISKTHKMKTMNKKQLRQIKKRQVNARTGEIEFVSPWGGGKKK